MIPRRSRVFHLNDNENCKSIETKGKDNSQSNSVLSVGAQFVLMEIIQTNVT